MRWSRLLYALFPLLLLFSCNGKGQLDGGQKVNSYKVAVVLPSSEKAELSKIVDWAQETIKAAQMGQESRIELDLEWIDEDGSQMAREVSRVAHDNSYAAIIGNHASSALLPACHTHHRFPRRPLQRRVLWKRLSQHPGRIPDSREVKPGLPAY